MNAKLVPYNPAMARATLAGRKTQTRRPVSPQPSFLDEAPAWRYDGFDERGGCHYLEALDANGEPTGHSRDIGKCCYGEVGDTLIAVRASKINKLLNCILAALWPPPVFGVFARMPITNLRAERLQAISKADAIAEGIERVLDHILDTPIYKDYTMRSNGLLSPIASFATLWDTLYATRGLGWDANPWIWVIEHPKL